MSRRRYGCSGRPHEGGRWRSGVRCGDGQSLGGEAVAYRPFDGTDGAVAETGEIEIELGPVEYFREGAEPMLLAPDLRINYGFIPDWEASLAQAVALWSALLGSMITDLRHVKLRHRA